MSEYKGNRWYKCDFHIHTTSSNCYESKEDSAQQWVARAIEQGLTSVAVTDHNDYRGIEPIMEEGAKQNLPVFPGVEITCDSSKIHMLVLFDTDKKADTVRDFLNRCDIDSEAIGHSAGTSMSVFEVCEIAKKRGAMVIAAHIDEFNAISAMNLANLKKLLEEGYIDAVQVSNAPVWRKFKEDKNAEAMIETIQAKYGPAATAEEIDKWRKCYHRAEEAGLPMLAFSDNPAGPGESHHGLWGIGSNYTWIMMDDSVDLESIRQALITSDSRIKMMWDCPDEPVTEPDFWIKSLEVRNSVLNPHQPIHLDFHPQLNCIIGGRGSGKSSIVHILSGMYQCMNDSILKDCLGKHLSCYTSETANSTGLFTDETEIEINFIWFKSLYRLLVTNINSPEDQKYQLFSVNNTVSDKITAMGDNGIRSMIAPRVFVANEIEEIAKTPGAFLSYIDKMIPDMYILLHQRDYYRETLVNLALSKETASRLFQDQQRTKDEQELLNAYRTRNLLLENVEKAFENRIDQRQKYLDLIESFKDSSQELDIRISELNMSYMKCLQEISSLRQSYIDDVLNGDENYKITVIPHRAQNSFYDFAYEVFNVNSEVIREDVKKLADILFKKDTGHDNYVQILNCLRSGESPDTTAFSDYFTHLVKRLNDYDFQRLIYFCPEDDIEMAYHPTGVKKFFPMTEASQGEKVCAILAFMLAGGYQPLVIDQPEDSVDNRIIYDEILPKIRRAKGSRQLILTTYNANIATNADAEMIISLDHKSKFTRIKVQGPMDYADVRRELCDVLEGSQDAFVQRMRKYQTEYF